MNRQKSMALTHPQQVIEAFKRCTRPLVCVGVGAGVDGYASAVALAALLRKLDKAPEIVAHDGPAAKHLSFLAGIDEVKTSPDKLLQFQIELDTSRVAVDELTYEKTADKLIVRLTPKAGFWEAHDVKTIASGYRFDLIITLGAPDLESVGSPMRDNPDFFYRTAIVNVDHLANNERYGAVNHVDLTATSLGEACLGLIEAIDPSLVDADLATALLTGMIAKTKGFKGPTVTPKTLEAAGRLMTRGARRDEIVAKLYRTRSVATLRLWGRALARLKASPEAKLAWTLLARADFMHAGAEEEELADVIEELIGSCPDARVAAVLYESRDGSVRAIVHAERPYDAGRLVLPLKGEGGPDEAHVRWSGVSIGAAEKDLSETLAHGMKS
jgi:nanoRNase/pAp phosphatase (c-di-AMP/oligoRNAs hydrolase)